MNALLLTALLIGQCGPNGCPAPVSYSQPVASYEWRKFNEDSYGLFSGGMQIGLFCPSRNTYWAVDTRTQTYGVPQAPPINPPVKAETPKSTGTMWETSGVDKSRISQKERYASSSGDVSKQSAFNTIGDTVPNDSNHLHVTFIDKDEKRAVAAMEDFKRHAPDVAKTVHLKAYQADDPTVATSGFVTDGTPTVYIQQGQKVVGREQNYPGAEAIAQAVRKKQADYDPSKDPSIVGSDIFNKLIAVVKANPLISLLAGLALLFIFKKGEKK